jgi:putative hydrolase of the HAD superfamily
MAGIRCVVFDIDDTLYLEREYVRSGFAAVGRWAAEQLNIADFHERAWARFEAGTRRRVFNEVLGECGIEATADLVELMVTIYRVHRPAISLLPDAAAALDALSGRVELAAVSDGPLESQRAKAAALGLEKWLNPIVLTAELGPGHDKPHPLGFQTVEQATGHRARQCVYVADNPAKDFLAPAELGWHTIRVRRRGGLHAQAPHGDDVHAELSDLVGLADVLILDG